MHQRLESLVKKIRVQRIVQEVNISSAQLYRYLKGTPIPHHRLAKICEIGGVSSDWLLYGEQPKYLAIGDVLESMGHVTQVTLTTLQLTNEIPAWRPSELKTLIPLLVLNELNHRRYAPAWRLTEPEFLRALDVLRQMRIKMLLEPYVRNLIDLYSRPDEHLPSHLAGPLCGYIDNANQAYFESQAGENYYQRVAYHIRPVSLEWLRNLVNVLEQRGTRNRLKLLDAGAGTGRYIRYLHRNYPDWFELHGIERSSKAFRYIHEFESQGELPKGCIVQDDYCSNTSLSKHTFDVVISYMNLHYFPYVPDTTDLGVGQALSRLAQWLKPGGILHVVLRHGLKQVFLPYYSRAHSPGELTEIGKKLGLTLLQVKPKRYSAVPLPGHEVPIGFEEIIELIFIKN